MITNERPTESMASAEAERDSRGRPPDMVQYADAENGALTEKVKQLLLNFYGSDLRLSSRMPHLLLDRFEKGLRDDDCLRVEAAYNRFGRAYNRFGRAYNRFGR